MKYSGQWKQFDNKQDEIGLRFFNEIDTAITPKTTIHLIRIWVGDLLYGRLVWRSKTAGAYSKPSLTSKRYMKNVQIGSFFWSVFSRIQSE